MQPPPLDIHPALFVMLAFGALLSFSASIWFLIVGFQEHVLWGVGMLFCGFTHFAFLIVHFKKAWMPTLLSLLAAVVMGVPLVIIVTQAAEAEKLAKTQAQAARQNAPVLVDPDGRPELVPMPADNPATLPPPTDPTDVPVKVLTLTGAKRSAYAKLGESKAWTVIRWANADVTDDDLESLHGMTELRELDLSGTQVTDDGLHALEDSEKLEVLRLARTAITEEGFREHVLPIESLTTLDIRGTKIPKKVGLEWKAAAPGRKLTQ